jgi:hypothetical protein
MKGLAKIALKMSKGAKRTYKRSAVRARRFLRKHGDDILEAGANAALAGLAAAFGGNYTPKDKNDDAGAASGGRARGAAGAVADLPTLGSPKRAEKISSPTVDTIRGQIADLLKVAISFRDISSKHHKLLLDQHAQAVRVSREGMQERRDPASAVDATPEPTQGGDLMSATDLETDFQDLHRAIQDVIDRLNGISSGGGGGGGDLDIDLPSNRSKGPKGKGTLRRLLGRGANFLRGGMQGLANFGGTSVGVATAAMTAAIATTGAGLYAIDKFMKSTYNDANKPLAELERRYGMKAIKNSSGFTTHFEIKGKKYPSDNLPPDYQTLLDAYGPTADPRTPATKNALSYIQKNREHFKSLEKETQRRQVQAGIQPAKPGQTSSPMGSSTTGAVTGGGAQAVSATPPPSATKVSTGAAANVGGGGGGTKLAPQKQRDASASPEAPPSTAAAAIQEAAMAPPLDQTTTPLNISTPQGIQAVRQEQVRTGFVGTGNVPDPTYYNVGSLPASIMFYMPHVKPDGTHPTLNEARF